VYRLTYDLGVEAVHDALPPSISEALTVALDTACQDPLGATEPYGEDDGIMRWLITPQTSAILLIGHTLKTVTVLQIHYLA
jgi:hypothetical protein